MGENCTGDRKEESAGRGDVERKNTQDKGGDFTQQDLAGF